VNHIQPAFNHFDSVISAEFDHFSFLNVLYQWLIMRSWWFWYAWVMVSHFDCLVYLSLWTVGFGSWWMIKICDTFLFVIDFLCENNNSSMPLDLFILPLTCFGAEDLYVRCLNTLNVVPQVSMSWFASLTFVHKW